LRDKLDSLRRHKLEQAEALEGEDGEEAQKGIALLREPESAKWVAEDWATFLNEILAHWRDLKDVRKERAEKIARKALRTCMNAGMTLQELSWMWDELEVEKIHKE